MPRNPANLVITIENNRGRVELGTDLAPFYTPKGSTFILAAAGSLIEAMFDAGYDGAPGEVTEDMTYQLLIKLLTGFYIHDIEGCGEMSPSEGALFMVNDLIDRGVLDAS